MDARPMLGPESKAKAKPKAKAKRRAKGDGPTPAPNPTPDIPPIPRGGKDPELEALELKRRSILTKNKWIERLKELDAQASEIICRAQPFADCRELLVNISLQVYTVCIHTHIHITGYTFWKKHVQSCCVWRKGSLT